jgi:hypothetical protein
MSGPSSAIAATFVEPRGMVRSIVAGVAGGELGGALGATAATLAASSRTPDASPLGKGQIGYLGVFPETVTLFRAKRGALKPKPTDEVVATAPRTELRAATVEKGRLLSVLELTFADGSTWAFDVPKVHLSGAKAIAQTLG